MTVAEVGNIVESYDNFNELDLPEKTVINHKRYKIVDQEG